MNSNDIALQLNSFTSDSQFTSRRDSKFELYVCVGQVASIGNLRGSFDVSVHAIVGQAPSTVTQLRILVLVFKTNVLSTSPNRSALYPSSRMETGRASLLREEQGGSHRSLRQGLHSATVVNLIANHAKYSSDIGDVAYGASSGQQSPPSNSPPCFGAWTYPTILECLPRDNVYPRSVSSRNGVTF